MRSLITTSDLRIDGQVYTYQDQDHKVIRLERVFQKQEAKRSIHHQEEFKKKVMMKVVSCQSCAVVQCEVRLESSSIDLNSQDDGMSDEIKRSRCDEAESHIINDGLHGQNERMRFLNCETRRESQSNLPKGGHLFRLQSSVPF